MLAVMSLLARGVDTELMSLIEEAGRNVQRAGLLLRDLLSEYPERGAAPPWWSSTAWRTRRSSSARRCCVAVRGRHRPDGRDPLEGHLRVTRGGRRRLRGRRTRARGGHAQAT